MAHKGEGKFGALSFWISYLAYRLLIAILAHMPLAISKALLRSLAALVFRLGGERVHYMMVNLRIAFPDRGEDALREVAKKSYENLALNILDVVRATRWTPSDFRERVSIDGIENLKSAFKRGHGVLALTLHLGNFELAIRRLPLEGVPVSAVGRPNRNYLIRDHLRAQRQRTGAVMMAHRKVIPQMLRQLRKGHVVPVLNDQYVRPRMGIFSPLFGKRCSTSHGIALLAIRCGTPIVPCYTIRDGWDHHRVIFLPELKIECSGDRQRDLEQIMEQCNGAIEQLVRKYPEQWMWSHRRFRHSPDFEGNPYLLLNRS